MRIVNNDVWIKIIYLKRDIQLLEYQDLDNRT